MSLQCLAQNIYANIYKYLSTEIKNSKDNNNNDDNNYHIKSLHF